jgi:hypothetical protein
MKKPEPPFLELGFYVEALHDADAFARVVETAISLGAVFTGSILAYRGPGVRHQRFAGLYEDEVAEELTIAVPELDAILYDNDLQIMTLDLAHAIGIVPNRYEFVMYSSISEMAATCDTHPVQLIADGSLFESLPPTPSGDAEAQRMGMLIYKRFLEMVKGVKPAYASITSEISLESPTDLRAKQHSYAFGDCYVQNRFIGHERVSALLAMCRNAYVEELEDGYYVSTNRFFNPAGVQWESNQPYWLTGEIAKLIAMSGG